MYHKLGENLEFTLKSVRMMEAGGKILFSDINAKIKTDQSISDIKSNKYHYINYATNTTSILSVKEHIAYEMVCNKHDRIANVLATVAYTRH